MSLSWPHQLALKTYSTTKMFPREETFSLGPRHSEKIDCCTVPDAKRTAVVTPQRKVMTLQRQEKDCSKI
jgi:hypothetical protein